MKNGIKGLLALLTAALVLVGCAPQDGAAGGMAEAKKLLAEAGYPDGKGFPAMKILYNTSEAHKKIAEYIQEQWKTNLGIDVELVNEEWKTYLDTRDQGNFDIARAGWLGDYQDPNTFLDMFVTDGGGNDGKYSNPKFDEAIKAAAAMPAGPDRMAKLREAETYFITEDMGVMPIYFYTTNNLIDTKKWSGWHTNTMDWHPTKSIAPAGGNTKTEFVIVNGAEPQSLDPALIEGVPEHRLYYSLFEGLVSTDPVTAKAVPGLAESWTISEDGKTYTFKLRDAVWSDGVAITADTVAKSWLRILDPKTASPYAWFPAMFVKGAEAFNAGTGSADEVGVKAVDPKTFQMELVGPLPYVLDALAHYAFSVVPLHAIEKFGTDWTKPENFVGNGPFILKEWKPAEHILVVPNDKYWDKAAVKLSAVKYLPIEDNNTGYNMFINGDVDWMHTVPSDKMDEAKLRADYQNAANLGTYYYIYNTKRPPLDNPKVRKALAMAFDRQALIDGITKGGQLPAWSMVPDMAGYPVLVK